MKYVPALGIRALTRSYEPVVHVTFEQGLATAPPLAEGSFDRVVMSLVVHHLSRDDEQRALRAAHALLRHGGRLTSSTGARRVRSRTVPRSSRSSCSMASRTRPTTSEAHCPTTSATPDSGGSTRRVANVRSTGSSASTKPCVRDEHETDQLGCRHAATDHDPLRRRRRAPRMRRLDTGGVTRACTGAASGRAYRPGSSRQPSRLSSVRDAREDVSCARQGQRQSARLPRARPLGAEQRRMRSQAGRVPLDLWWRRRRLSAHCTLQPQPHASLNQVLPGMHAAMTSAHSCEVRAT